ncbi:MAG: alpha/beta fold hydrolase [Rhodococcus sp. (in: high G+C Gram-positive bacteria)]
MAAICEALDARAVSSIGYSMGSIVATRLAIAHPGLVERLVIIGGPILSLIGLARNPVKT